MCPASDSSVTPRPHFGRISPFEPNFGKRNAVQMRNAAQMRPRRDWWIRGWSRNTNSDLYKIKTVNICVMELCVLHTPCVCHSASRSDMIDAELELVYQDGMGRVNKLMSEGVTVPIYIINTGVEVFIQSKGCFKMDWYPAWARLAIETFWSNFWPNKHLEPCTKSGTYSCTRLERPPCKGSLDGTTVRSCTTLYRLLCWEGARWHYHSHKGPDRALCAMPGGDHYMRCYWTQSIGSMSLEQKLTEQ